MLYFSKIFTSVCSNTLFLIFFIAFLGYLLGRINIKGVQLGTAAVFLVALLFGHFGFKDSSLLHRIGLITTDYDSLKISMSLVQNIGLICFVTSVGLISGPGFFHDLKRNIKSYTLIAFTIIALGSICCVTIISISGIDSAMAVGIFSGAMTSTPAFAAAQDAVSGSELLYNEISVGYAIAYPFGVIGKVLFIQLVPKLLKADMVKEREKLLPDNAKNESVSQKKLIDIDSLGMWTFALTVISGILLGKISIPLPGGASFSLGNTGGVLLMGLIFGHLGHIGSISLKSTTQTLKTFQEFGLMLFLIGAGVPGGSGFVEIIRQQGAILFVYGAIITTLPMVCGYLLAKYVLKLPMLNSLGSITGGMTSTPALGTLIAVAQTDRVVASYAATYPVALVLIVLTAQFIVTLM